MDILHADQATPSMPSEARLRATMEQSDRDLAAGQTVALADVLAELDAVADKLESRRKANRI